jgi:hypothetical protein
VTANRPQPKIAIYAHGCVVKKWPRVQHKPHVHRVHDKMKLITRSDVGAELNDDLDCILNKNTVILGEPATWHLSTMGSATAWFAVGTGEYARIFRTENFKKATVPVLAAYGDHW